MLPQPDASRSGIAENRELEGAELIDFEASDAWALVDHQFSHVFVRERNPAKIQAVAELFADAEGIDGVAAGDARANWDMSHERAGDVVLISDRNSWQAYYWWNDDARAPAFARTVIFTENRATTPSNFISILRPKACRWMPR